MVGESFWNSWRSLPSPQECDGQVWGGLRLNFWALCKIDVFLRFGHVASALATKTFLLLLSHTDLVPFLIDCCMGLHLRVRADPSHQCVLVEARYPLGNVCRGSLRCRSGNPPALCWCRVAPGPALSPRLSAAWPAFTCAWPAKHLTDWWCFPASPGTQKLNHQQKYRSGIEFLMWTNTTVEIRGSVSACLVLCLLGLFYFLFVFIIYFY